jgi:hypothetical protein
MANLFALQYVQLNALFFGPETGEWLALFAAVGVKSWRVFVVQA